MNHSKIIDYLRMYIYIYTDHMPISDSKYPYPLVQISSQISADLRFGKPAPRHATGPAWPNGHQFGFRKTVGKVTGQRVPGPP